MELVFKKFEIKKIQAPNFVMSPVELKDYIEFEVKRVYFITKPTGDSGQHCHLKEEEMFILLNGTVTAVIDQGKGLEEHKLVGPTDAFYVGNYVWHGFKDFSPDAVLLAISSTNYNPNREDYIEDYAKYKETVASLN